MVENINRLNVWSNNLITDFERMVQQHHESLNNFHRVGTMLEASGKIYGLRVDSVHADVIRMSSGIQRQSLSHSSMDIDSTTDISVESIQPIRRRCFTTCTTVVRSQELINAPLQILEELKCPLNRMIGMDHVSVAGLFQNVFRSKRYAWTIQSNNKFWMDQSVANGLDEFDELDEPNVALPVVNWIPSIADVIRPKLRGYEMANSPCEHFRYSEWFTTARSNQPDLEDNPQTVNIDVSPVPMNSLHLTMPTDGVPCTTATLNRPDLEDNHQDVEMDLHFDVDVDPVPVPVNNVELTMPEIGVSFTVDDRNALRRCTVLHPNTSVADDLRPLSSTPLAYSYRRLTNVSLSTDAGHWKLPSIIQSISSEREPTRRHRRRKVVKKDKPVDLTHALSDSVEQNFMSVDDPRTQAIRHSNQCKWKSTKLTMPSRMGHLSAVEFLPLMLGCMSNEEPVEPTVPDAAIDLAADHDIHVQPHDAGMEVDVDMDPVDVAPANDSVPNAVPVEMTIEWEPNVYDHGILLPMPQTPLHITPANVNVKAITRRCLEIIRALEATGDEATFGQVYRQLEADGQRITPALIFSSILELANRNNFRLEKIDGTNDFVIRRI